MPAHSRRNFSMTDEMVIPLRIAIARDLFQTSLSIAMCTPDFIVPL
jgi:hypothetical protein